MDKCEIGHIEGVPDEQCGKVNDLPTYDDVETARVLRKVDWRLLPVLTLLYVLSFLDKGNIGNAKVAGMNDDLNLTGQQYNITLTVRVLIYATG